MASGGHHHLGLQAQRLEIAPHGLQRLLGGRLRGEPRLLGARLDRLGLALELGRHARSSFCFCTMARSASASATLARISAAAASLAASLRAFDSAISASRMTCAMRSRPIEAR